MPEENLELVRKIFGSADELQVGAEIGAASTRGSRHTLEVAFPMRYLLARTRRAQEYTLKLRMEFENGAGGWKLVAVERR